MSRDVPNQCLAKLWSQPFPLAVLLGVSPLREAVFGVPSLRETVVGPDSASSSVAQIEK